MLQKVGQQHRPAAALPAQITVAAPDSDPERSPMPAAQDQLTAERGGGDGLGILARVERIQGRQALQAGQNASTEAWCRCGFRGGHRIRCRQNGKAFGQAGRIAAGGQPPAPLAAAARRQQGEGAIKTHGNAATARPMPALSRRGQPRATSSEPAGPCRQARVGPAPRSRLHVQVQRPSWARRSVGFGCSSIWGERRWRSVLAGSGAASSSCRCSRSSKAS